MFQIHLLQLNHQIKHYLFSIWYFNSETCLTGLSRNLAEIDDIALAISSDKPITLLDLMPAFGKTQTMLQLDHC